MKKICDDNSKNILEKTIEITKLREENEKIKKQLEEESGKESLIEDKSEQHNLNSSIILVNKPKANNSVSVSHLTDMYNKYISGSEELPSAFNEINIACRGIRPRIDDVNGIKFYYADTGDNVYLYPSRDIIDNKNTSKYNYKIYNCSRSGKKHIEKPAVISIDETGKIIEVIEIGNLSY